MVGRLRVLVVVASAGVLGLAISEVAGGVASVLRAVGAVQAGVAAVAAVAGRSLSRGVAAGDVGGVDAAAAAGRGAAQAASALEAGGGSTSLPVLGAVRVHPRVDGVADVGAVRAGVGGARVVVLDVAVRASRVVGAVSTVGARGAQT